ncbi:6-phosphofructokinase [Persephonella atlantica]|uniref:ATP-dependent 6-phosphofructokinase n=1 Tax=Persephonella atlantica TaxID=2699429 RepID=A0ABS1GHK0_9AQUI|nr:6-phosphofructokinase [Persephonella atlantica]MBK3332325.1 6-phosphofructokinase [Persephonella atlantica]
MKRIAVLTSGGDAPGLNACIRAVVRAGHYYNLEVIGVKRGFKGLIEKEFINLSPRDVSQIINRGGTVLLSAREERFHQYQYRKIAAQNLRDEKIDALFVIGGNGSFQGAYLLVKEFGIPVIGIPKTIDNDTYGTEYTIGFDTAVNNAVQAIDKIRDTSMSHERVFVIEVMGRKSGFIALSAGIATGADVTLIPEYPFPMHVIVDSILQARKRGKHFSIVIVAEGVASGKDIAQILSEKLKPYDFGGVRYSVLGYIQRGGSPTAYDRIIASRFGVFAVEQFVKGKENIMVALENGKVVEKPLEVSFGKIKKPDLSDFELNNILTL